jgi:hypothetical protein
MAQKGLAAIICGTMAFGFHLAAAAQPLTAEDRAREAFSRGLELEGRGDVVAACAAFRESLTFVRELGPVRKVSQCDSRDGRIVAAADGLEELLTRLPPDAADRPAIITELAALNQRVATLRLAFRADAPPGLAVRVDGQPVVGGAGAIELDPGDHEISISAHNAPAKTIRVSLAEGQSSTIEVPPAEAAPVEKSDALKIAGFSVGAVGVGALIGAAVTGGLVLAKDAEYDTCAPAACAGLKEDGDRLLIVNGVLWGVAIAAIGTGATLLIVDAVADGPSPRVALDLLATPTSLGLRGRF